MYVLSIWMLLLYPIYMTKMQSMQQNVVSGKKTYIYQFLNNRFILCVRGVLKTTQKLSSPGPKPLAPNPKLWGLGLTEGHGKVHHGQGEHHQTYLLHHYQNAASRSEKFSTRRTKCSFDTFGANRNWT